MSLRHMSLELHEIKKGKIEVAPKVMVRNKKQLGLIYTPWVAEPCKEIQKDINKVYKYTSKGNMIAIVTDGTAVLGLGNIGPEAALPVMEGKAVLFKEFGGIDAFPICLDTSDTEEIIRTVQLICTGFGGVNLEDISAPRCFEIEQRLKKELLIPVFHDDQHGTAIVVLAGLLNSLKIVNKKIKNVCVVINGAGAAGVAIGKMLKRLNPKDILICDRKGIINSNTTYDICYKNEIARWSNKENKKGSLVDALEKADVFIGVSSGNILAEDIIRKMNVDPIIFALANPTPEILPQKALKAGAKIVATGRSDYPNQINNVLAFPGVFKGALSVRATEINEQMQLAAAIAISEIVTKDELTSEYIIPDISYSRVVDRVSEAVSKAALKSGVANM
ncbi:NAD(P)-dependent malic enzyme [Schnuerera ultunensis]|uniref:NADP-dependent malic enzyme (Conversion of malate into pyruvate) n=1 Tax=[Clostridium] ultunense Esp TaxID=1288971 RepID=A0A1M4PKF7_9FIRM|nr:NADP-dependent malic enzyme [Schnuerera ultunensis]SHD75960.1 NADP-dependent malic enzyme (conversion of malate into pyruvate) [[Clostridium] ultunense Esp]